MKEGFDDVLDVLLLPLELPFQLLKNLEEKVPELPRPPLPHEFLRNSELRNLIPPRPPLPHEILDQAIKPGSNPGKPLPMLEIGKRVGIQSFVNQVCQVEGWETPRVEVPSEEDWPQIARELTPEWAEKPFTPPEKVYGISSPSLGKIFLNPSTLDITTVLHELIHYNTPLEFVIEMTKELGPEMVGPALEMRAETQGRRLVRKYREDWKQKTGLPTFTGNPGGRERPSEWRWTMIPTPIEDIPDKDLIWNRDILIDIWKRFNTALRMMDSGIIDRDRQVVIIREAHWTTVKYLVDPTDNISTRMRLEKFGRQDILDKLAYAGVRLKRDTVESKLTVPTKPPPYWVAGEKVFEFPLVVRRIVDQSRSMVHDGIRILDKELERRTFPFSSREEILGIMPMEPLPADYADIRKFGRDLQYAVQATGYDPCYTAQGQKAIQLDLGDRTMKPAKKWADLLTRQGCEVTTFHGHHPIYHVHAICLYPEKQEERDRFLRELMIQIHETFGPPESTWFYDI